MRRSRRAAAIGPVLRRSWTVWVLPLLLAWLFFTADSAPSAAEGYWVAATAAGTSLAIFVAIACAVCGAWEGFRARALDDAVATAVRSPARIMVGTCWPVLCWQLLRSDFGLWLYLPPSGTSSTPDFRILAIELLLLTAYAAGGYVLGRVFPVVIAVPLATIASFGTGPPPDRVASWWAWPLQSGDSASAAFIVAALALALVAARRGRLRAGWRTFRRLVGVGHFP